MRGYQYDGAWNVSLRTNNGTATAFGVDGKNQLTIVGGSAYGYDGNGNLTALPAVRGGTVTYGYDDENRLVRVQTNGVNTPYTAFRYDGLGRLRGQESWVYGPDGSETQAVQPGGAGTDSAPPGGGGSSYQLASAVYYVYDGNRVVQERDVENNPVVDYTRGKDLGGGLEGAGGIGGLLARSDADAGGGFADHAYYHADGNGNITCLETASETLWASYRYDAFGNLLNSSGFNASANTYRFSSKEWMPSVNGYYYLYRFYIPSLQRWLNRDPIEEDGGINLYAYVDNNPINEVDPFGLDGELTPGAAEAAMGPEEEAAYNAKKVCDAAKKAKDEADAAEKIAKALKDTQEAGKAVSKSVRESIYKGGIENVPQAERDAAANAYDIIAKNAKNATIKAYNEARAYYVRHGGKPPGGIGSFK